MYLVMFLCVVFWFAQWTFILQGLQDRIPFADRAGMFQDEGLLEIMFIVSILLLIVLTIILVIISWKYYLIIAFSGLLLFPVLGGNITKYMWYKVCMALLARLEK